MKRPNKPLPCCGKGFTLTELMVVIAISVVMIGFTYSGFSSWQRRERVRAAANELASFMKYARFQAIERNMSHVVDIDKDDATFRVVRIDNLTAYDALPTPGTPIDNSTPGITMLEDMEVDVARKYGNEVVFSDNTTTGEFPLCFGVRGLRVTIKAVVGGGRDTEYAKNDAVAGFSNADMTCNVVISPIGSTEVTCNDIYHSD